jgi:multicomponent Na+:H+ antiporter subunit C
MSLAFAILVGVLFAVAIYLLLRESAVDHVFGIILLGHAANLIVLGAGRLVRGAAPVLEGDRAIADPLPQALVLTAIVIGFGVVAYALVLAARLTQTRDSDRADHLEEDDDAS